MKTKQIVMASAHAIYKMQNVTFSEALTLAWDKVKQGFKAIIMNRNRLVKSIGLGYETVYFNELVFTSVEVLRISIDNSGASKWYDGKTFNND